MRRRSVYAATIAVGGLVAGATIALGAVPAASKPPQVPWSQGPVTIYSDNFTPFSRMPDGDSANAARYLDPDTGYGPGGSPQLFYRVGGTGHDAFFNSPDLTIGTTPMSATSAEVCLTITNQLETSNVLADVLVGVQDLDRNFILATDDQTAPVHTVVPGDPPCVTMTFDPAVKLVNHPHLVTVLDLRLRGLDMADSWAEVDGVTYQLRPTQPGDATPVAQPQVAGLPNMGLPAH